ncbi:hypothetical protein [Thioalkalivibrio sp.]|uniref:hypothetical protein n=1 Tax=Thioalkalivibrio sp. TaxID=2093813 RepID=UPI0035699A23
MDQHTRAVTLMDNFATRTGVKGSEPPRRYLWTDAFAVCNLLGLQRTLGEPHLLGLALKLVEQVHAVLGRHHPDDPRVGWLSGLDDAEQRQHPTRAGLRIGKELPERTGSEPFDERLEWQSEGQYFHYLTRWMHALEQVARVTGDRRYHRWAVELCETAHQAFVYRDERDGTPRMWWKMNVELDRPQVTSMGHHDPLDGWITALQLQWSPLGDDHARLAPQAADFRSMCVDRGWVTSDPLGIGGLLTDAWRLEQLVPVASEIGPEEVDRLLDDGRQGLEAIVRQGQLAGPANRRLPFRELGLGIGLHAVERILDTRGAATASPGVLRGFLSMADSIQAFWLQPINQQAATWHDHLDINSVMLATSLAPEGYLSPAA